LAVWLSIALADATSGGQEVSAIPAVAESETIVTTLNIARTFFIESVLSDCVFTSDLVSTLLHRLARWGPDSRP